MIRCAQILFLAAPFALATLPAAAQSAEAPHQARRAVKARKPAVAPAASPFRGINTPSTDFSKIERPAEDQGPNGPTFRPTIGSGGMGIGAGF